MDRRRILFTTAAMFLCLVAAGCAAGPNELVNTWRDGDSAGFWLGLWHGMILPITIWVSLFSDHVSIYEIHNSGAWYNLGFFFGIASVLGGGGSATAASRRG